MQILTHSVAICVQENAEVRLKRLFDALWRYLSRFAIIDSLRELPHHSPFCLRAKHAVMWQKNISEEIDALIALSDCYLVRV